MTEMTRSNHGDDTWESQRCHVAISAVSCQVYDCVDAVLHAQPLLRRADGTRIIELRPQLSWHKVEMSREKSREKSRERAGIAFMIRAIGRRVDMGADAPIAGQSCRVAAA